MLFFYQFQCWTFEPNSLHPGAGSNGPNCPAFVVVERWFLVWFFCVSCCPAVSDVSLATPLYPKEFQLVGTHLEMLDPGSIETVTMDSNAAVFFHIRHKTSMCLGAVGLSRY